MTEPLLEMPARPLWRIRYGEIIFYSDAPCVTFSLTPRFPACSDQLEARGIVWDLWRLMDSVRRPGAYSILNSECGYPPDAYLETDVLVSHPDDATVVWELDCKDLGPALEDAFAGRDGFIRLVFERRPYEAYVRAMLRKVQHTAHTAVPVAHLSEAFGFANIENQYPGLRYVSDYIFEPTVHGDCDADEFCALDPKAEWPREPLFAPGTRLEVGLFGSELLHIDARAPRECIGRWFTRWEARAAFGRWMSCVSPRYALQSKDASTNRTGDPNEFVLRPGEDAEACHRAGDAFVAVLRRCLGEGTTAPGVEVRYVRCEVPSADIGLDG